MVKLRSGKDLIINSHESTSTENMENLTRSELETILKPLEDSIETIKNSLGAIRTMFHMKMKKLQTRVNVIESRCALNENLIYLQGRKIDDNEQYSRKTNLKLVGIELKKRDNPRELMEHIQKTVAEFEIDVHNFDYDRCHRMGKIYKYKGVTYQNVLLRLRSWTARDNIYKKRKELPFKIQADLTTRRSELLAYAKDQVVNEPEANRVAEFVFCDENCKMKIFSKLKKFYAFSSEYEFLSIINRLDNETNYTEEFHMDEENGRPDLQCPYDLFC